MSLCIKQQSIYYSVILLYLILSVRFHIILYSPSVDIVIEIQRPMYSAFTSKQKRKKLSE